MNIGIIGLGKMGQNHLKELSKNENFTIRALLDLRIDRDIQYPFFDNIDTFLRTELDCVIISSPTNTHLELAKSCFKKVKTVLIEKPLALNLEQMKELKDCAIKEDVALAVGFSERFNPAVVALKNELKDEKIISINIRRFSTYPLRILDVGILQDLTVHDLDLALFFANKKIEKSELFKLNKKDEKREDEALCVLDFGETLACVHQSWNCKVAIRQLDIISEKATYNVDLLNFTLKKNGNLVPLPQTTPLQGEHNSLLNLIKNRQSKLLANIDDSIAIQEILEAK
ncbi:Gfo/Idh/MocA family oxidoreductase [uncultured Campylobacter sp.]|uniref:Gfo/Idh/MocA family protein n=1 Tax=uncultured Campylobacter sp. TaxID=218934 RepID=UPI00260AC772|nr:Gfo/Idh/MocA family oxidoreductase [uncultured Campylobacter sp.]